MEPCGYRLRVFAKQVADRALQRAFSTRGRHLAEATGSPCAAWRRDPHHSSKRGDGIGYVGYKPQTGEQIIAMTSNDGSGLPGTPSSAGARSRGSRYESGNRKTMPGLSRLGPRTGHWRYLGPAGGCPSGVFFNHFAGRQGNACQAIEHGAGIAPRFEAVQPSRLRTTAYSEAALVRHPLKLRREPLQAGLDFAHEVQRASHADHVCGVRLTACLRQGHHRIRLNLDSDAVLADHLC